MDMHSRTCQLAKAGRPVVSTVSKFYASLVSLNHNVSRPSKIGMQTFGLQAYFLIQIHLFNWKGSEAKICCAFPEAQDEL